MPDRTQPELILSHLDVGVLVEDRDARVLFANDAAAVPTFDASGTVDRVYCTLADVTGNVGSARATAADRALLRTVTDAVPGVIYQHVLREDDTDAFPFISARVTELMGATPAAIQRSSVKLWERVHPEDRDRVRDATLAEARLTRTSRDTSHEQRFDAEFRVQTPDGEWRWVRAQSRGRAVGRDVVCQGLITDITEWRMLSDQVRAAQRQELIGTLVAGIAHNFNNMLAAILPNLDRARKRATGELRQELNDAHDAAESAAELVRHLMLLVRRDEPRAAEPVDVGALVQDIMRMCRRTFDQRIALETTTPTSPLVVLGRRSDLQQVILNLCINARDAVEAAPVPLIETGVTALPGHRVGITVRDTGVGMTAEAQRRVGQPFYTTKPPGKGTGLGLATVLGIVREMGGDLTWTSKLGAGTTFEIALPQASAAEAPPIGSPRARGRALPARWCSSSTTNRWCAARSNACSAASASRRSSPRQALRGWPYCSSVTTWRRRWSICRCRRCRAAKCCSASRQCGPRCRCSWCRAGCLTPTRSAQRGG
jgi:two-component system cell cycle sensor histidine kinase/response regulator CckA